MASSKKYDVFLSFRGEDTRYGITSHIYRALDCKKIKTYIDDKCLERGDEISPALLAAIEGSRISVVVFSKDYASSSWCLSELVHIHKCRREFGQVVLPIFFEVDPSHVRKQDRGSYRECFKRHEKNPKHTAKTIEEWRSALKASADLSGLHYSRSNSLAMFRAESALVDDLVNSVLRALNGPAMPVETDRFDGLIGMGNHFRKIKSLLMTGSSGLQIVGIWGMPGVGKTTIAKAVSSRLFREFESYYFLENVRESSEKHGLKSLRDGLIARLLGDEKSDSGSLLPSPITDHAKERLLRTKVLLVLDDVSDKRQLEYLVGDHIGHGSRVIVTTRDEGVLRGTAILRAAFEKYEVKVMGFKEALVLFSLTTFREKSPPLEYEDVSKQVVKYIGSNPLAVKVFGSHLRSLRNPCRDNWEMELDKLKECSHGDIMKTLRISYDALGETEQKIFLDIACFFKGMQREYVQSILNGCELFATTGIDDLIDKSLITLDANDMLNMHDLMQQLGWQIVRRESQEPGNRSRLWIAKHAYHVFENDTGSALIQGIFLKTSKFEEFLHLKPRVFQSMMNLRLLAIYGNGHHGAPKLKVEPLECFPKSLRYFVWKKYPLKSLPSGFSPRYLVVIKLIDCQLEQLWPGTEKLDNLKIVDLRNSANLSQLPNLSCAPNLETLILNYCTSLLQVPWDIFGKHNRLLHLDLSFCKKLSGFPESIDSRGLKTLQLQGCPEFKIVPRIASASLVTLDISSTGIENVPSSIGYINTISQLFLRGCISLVSIPQSISQLHLKTFDLSDCPSLEEFAEFPRNIEELNMHNSALKEVPLSIAGCSLLRKISFRFSKRLETVPGSLFNLASLVSLDLSHCSALMELPEIPGTNSNLEQLNMEETGIACLPSSIGNLKKLKELRLENCKNLKSVDNLCGSQLTHLSIWGCRNLRRTSELPFTLKHLNATGCISLEEVALVSSRQGLSEKTRKSFWDISRKVTLDTFDFSLFGNCFRLNQRSQDNLITGFQLKVLHMASQYYTAAKCEVKIPPAVTVCFPGSNFPYWFDLYSEDSGSSSSSLTFPLPEDGDILGFALCTVAHGPFNLSTDVFCEVEFKEKGEARPETSTVCSALVGPENSMVIPSSLVNYVVMWYKHWDYSHLNGRAIEASFRFSVARRGDYPASCSAPAKCGVHIVRSKDFKDLDLIDDAEVCCSSSDEIGRSSNSDLLESSGMMIVEHSTLNGGENSRSTAWQVVCSILMCCSPKEH